MNKSPQTLLIIGLQFFFSNGRAAQIAQKQKSCTPKSSLMQDWVFRLGSSSDTAGVRNTPKISRSENSTATVAHSTAYFSTNQKTTYYFALQSTKLYVWSCEKSKVHTRH